MQHQRRDSFALLPADRRMIDEDHERLERFIRDLHDTCAELESADDCGDCDRERVASCQGRLTSFLYDFLDIMDNHFETEEKLMEACLTTPEQREYVHGHKAAHEKLRREVKVLLRELAEMNKQGSTMMAIRQFYRQVAVMFGNHAHEFDDYL